MANVTLHGPGDAPALAAETPSQRTVRQANALNYVTDETGRRIGWGKLDALADFDLCEIAGANSSNQAWMTRATLAFSVREIDGDQISRPNTKLQLRALVARLGDAGMVAVGRDVFGEAGDDEDPAAQAAATETDRAKNSVGTPTSG